MKMKVNAVLLEIIWYLARGLVYAKRGFVFAGRQMAKLSGFFWHWYKQTLGFAIFKIIFYIKKRLFPELHRGNVSHWYRFGERWVLQIVALGVAFFFIIPQTKLFKTPFGEVPGKKTLLYALVGPGDQDFALSDGLVEETGISNPAIESELWKQGSISVEPSAGSENIGFEDQYSTTISGALVKPSYVATLPAHTGPPATPSQVRSGVIEYQIKTGDVLGKIAKEHGVSIETILAANKLTIRSILRPGTILKIPPADGVLYVVAKGDTVSKIAQRYRVSADEITKFNNLDDRSLRVGAQILIPGAKPLPTPVVTRPTTKPVTKTPIINVPPSVNIGGYIWPTGARVITQYYGLRHTGVDIAGPTGLPNYAARDGVVIKSQCGWNGGYGCYIIIDHGNGVQTLYAHNSQLLVSPGEYVVQGQVIGLVGNTGRSTGPHLHFEVRVNGRRANPLQYVRR